MSRGRRKTVTTEEEVLPDGETQLTQAETEEQELAELADSLDLGKTGMVSIHRRGPGATRFAFVESVPVDIFFSGDPNEYVKGKFGGGDYQLKFGRDGVTVANKALSIDPRIKGQLDALPDAAKPESRDAAIILAIEKLAAATRPVDNNNEMLLALMTMVQQGQQQMAQAHIAALQAMQPKGGGLDLAKILPVLMPVVRDFVSSRRSGPAETMKDFLTTLRGAREFIGGARGNGDVSEEPREPGLLEKIIELAGPALFGSLAPQIASQPQGPAIGSVGASPHSDPGDAALARTGDASNSEPMSIQSDAPTVNLSDPIMLRMLVIQTIRAQYPKLLKAATKGTEPASYFDVVADEYEDTNPAALDMLVKILQEPNWAATLFGVKEETMPKREWFIALRQEFLDAWAEPVASQPEPAKAESK